MRKTEQLCEEKILGLMTLQSEISLNSTQVEVIWILIGAENSPVGNLEELHRISKNVPVKNL